MSRIVVDARGLLCPLPVIRLQDTARGLPGESELELIGTDPGIMQDVPAWCRINGHTIVDSWHEGNQYHILLKLQQ